MKTNIFILLAAIALFTGCQQAASTEQVASNEPEPVTPTETIKKGMIKVAILYPNEEGKNFNMDYYSEKHMPMVAELFGSALREYAIDKGVAGRTPEEPMPYLAAGYFYFDKLSDYAEAFGPNAEQILGDIPNYTDIQPVVQISEIVR